ncbi:MAG: BamA/TamA family outer membrane protein [Prevotellaceae bacterium]|jgi:outer membrane protein assembly factor BamA|nr:BamA/TamA family outer membrane protein [Prevotellaceae bacterium]
MEVNGEGLKKSELRSMIRQKPNSEIFALRFNLWLYNLSASDSGWVNEFLRNSGEPPVILDSAQAIANSRRMEQYIGYRGYYGSSAETIIKRKQKKADVTYVVNLAKPYTMRHIGYDLRDRQMDSLYVADKERSLLREGGVFDGEVLETEVNRIVQVVRTHGYYEFNKSYITYRADTAVGNRQVDITLILQREPVPGTANTRNHRVFYVNNLVLNADYDPVKAIQDRDYLTGWDTLNVNGLQVMHKGQPGIKPGLALMNSTIRLGELYNEQDVNRTYANFANLRLFKSVNIRFNENQAAQQDSLALDTLRYPLSASVVLSPFTLQSYDVGGEVSLSGNGLWGFAGRLNYQHKNMFRGAEIFAAGISAAFQKVQLYVGKPLQNSVELGATVSLNIPKIISPYSETFNRRLFSPRTQISVSGDYQQRPDYVRTLLATTYGYSWRNTRNMTYILNPIDFNIINITQKDSTFFASIQNNPYLLSSYQNSFLLGSTFAAIYNRSLLQRKDRLHVRFDAELKGNLLWALCKIFNVPASMDATTGRNTYSIWQTDFAQFAKFDVAATYLTTINEASSVAMRGVIGVGFAYSNSYSLPTDKMYYVGGANSMRGWQIRTLGPGTYAPDTMGNVLNHLADMRLELNAEYRFKLFWRLEGAVFLDAGNIWSFNDKDRREGALLKLSALPKQLALDWGLGLRLNFSVLVFRLDYGVKLHDPAVSSPYFLSPNRWFTANNHTYVIALNYPF